MRVLLAHNSLYYPAFGGGDKSNRLLMAALAARGHDVLVLARVAEFGAAAHAMLEGELSDRGLDVKAGNEGLQIELDGVAVRVFTHGRSLRRWTAACIREFGPEVILASTDDPAHLMLDAAMRAPGARVVYLIRALIALPFGPYSPHPNARAAEVLRHLDGVTTVSEHVAEYARKWGRLEAVHVPISLPDRKDYPVLGNFENHFVTLINPCAGKGLPIFVELARRMPEIDFAAVPTWGTTAADLERLRGLPNVTVLAPTDDVDEIYRQTRVALVPSLWAEARSRVTLEAMARGIPVMASNVDGMEEAMLGMDYVLPVRAAERYRPPADHSMVPKIDIPTQDAGPWVAALDGLIRDRSLYAAVSARVRARAMEYVRNVSVEPFEAYLAQVLRSPSKHRPASSSRGTDASAERRSLAVSRLRKRRKGSR